MKKVLILTLLLISIIDLFGQRRKHPKMEAAATVTVTSQNNSDSIQAMLDDYERVDLPPLSVFLQSVYEHPSTQIYEARRDAQRSELRVTQIEWLNYFRITGLYQYGQIVALNSTSATDTPLYYESNGKKQSSYTIGLSLSVPVGDLFSRSFKIRKQRAQLRETEYEYAIAVEERKLKILESYNAVIQQLAVLKAKSEAAALYNAQMKISEQDFINGKIDIVSLSLERGRRSTALVSYQEGRAALQNAITLLELLTNVKVLNR